MSLEDLQLIDNETIDNSFIERDCLKVYHQQAANINGSDQNFDIIFGANNFYHQIGNACLDYELKIGKIVAIAGDRLLVDANAIRGVNNAFAYCFKKARLSTTESSDIEHNKYCCQVSAIMGALTSKDGHLLSHFDKNDEEQAGIEKTSLYHHRINNHDLAANKGKIKGQLQLEHIFGFCKTFKKITKHSGFHLTFKKADLQDIFFTALGENFEMSSDNFFYTFQYSSPMPEHK